MNLFCLESLPKKKRFYWIELGGKKEEKE